MSIFKSDIISELIKNKKLEPSKFLIPNTNKKLAIEHFVIRNNYQSRKLGRPIGDYYLIDISKFNSDYKTTLISKKIAECIKLLIPKMDNKKILIVGLGNERIKSDSLGDRVCNKIIKSRLLDLRENGWPEVCGVTPSVMGETGIESFDIIDGIVNKLKIDYAIIIDSLCAGDVSRLGKSIQITNAGIVPGGGIHQPKKKFTKATLGCEVVTIGVPMMIYASTLCSNDNIDDNLILTFHDIDIVVENIAKIIGNGINLALFGIESIE